MPINSKGRAKKFVKLALHIFTRSREPYHHPGSSKVQRSHLIQIRFLCPKDVEGIFVLKWLIRYIIVINIIQISNNKHNKLNKLATNGIIFENLKNIVSYCTID
jgi:hypothetical protein